MIARRIVYFCLGIFLTLNAPHVWAGPIAQQGSGNQEEASQSAIVTQGGSQETMRPDAALPAKRTVRSVVAEVSNLVQPKLVKIYGAGGLVQLEGYQTGVLISSQGHVLTVWSTVLDTDATVVLFDGRRFRAELLGADLRLEIAVLKIDASELEFFELKSDADAAAGTRILAFSNLFNVASGGEPCSVQRGIVAAKTSLAARRGTYNSPYKGPVLVLDAVTNNPGAAGGVIVDYRGKWLGLLGKELRSASSNTWLNYAIPVSVLTEPVGKILSGQSNLLAAAEDENKSLPDGLTPEVLGLVLVPDVLEKTPPFVDSVLPRSSAEQAGVRPDDLVMYVGEVLTPSCGRMREELRRLDEYSVARVTLLRGSEVIEVQLRAEPLTAESDKQTESSGAQPDGVPTEPVSGAAKDKGLQEEGSSATTDLPRGASEKESAPTGQESP